MSEESRRKRRWDQPDKSMISPNISLPVIFPVTNVGFFPTNQLTEAPILQQQAVAKPQDELLIAREIVINDAEASVRYKLTRRQTQEEIQKSTGAVVITRGKYRPPNAMPDGEKPLYLHVSAGAHLKETAEKIIAVDRAAALVEDMMKPTMKAFNTSVYLGFDADPSLNIPTRIRGPNDQYINHIMNETGVTVLLRGHGSGHAGSANLEEGDQPLHLFLSSNNPKSLENARLLVENLLDTISRECGMARVAPVKVYAAVPPPQDLLTGVANCSAATAISPAANAGVCMYGPAAQAVQTKAVCYSQASGTCYAGLYPQATPFQQALTQPTVSTPSVNNRRPPQKRKFKELPPASNGPAATHQVPEDPVKSLLGNLTLMPPPKKLASSIPSNGLLPPRPQVVQAKDILTPPVPKFSSAPTKSVPPPPPMFSSTPSKNMPPPPPPKCNSTPSIHVSTTDVNSRKSIPENVPDTLVKLMEYGEDDDDDPD